MIIGIAVVLLGQIIIIGIATGQISVEGTVSSVIALVALMITISQYTDKSNTINDDDFTADCISKNLKTINGKFPNLSVEEKLIISALIKMKVRNKNKDVKMQYVIHHFSKKPDD